VRSAWSAIFVAFSLAPAVAAQSAADSAGIRQAALDYIEGWYSSDSSRMTRALHPELVKQIQNVDRAGRAWIQTQGASQLVRNTANGGGRETPAADRKTEVQILDIFRTAASVRIDAGPWIDYLHLVKWQGRWMILQVLWATR
jgi:hypothetical protein